MPKLCGNWQQKYVPGFNAMKYQLSLSLAKGYLKTNTVSFAKTKAVSFCGAKTSEANSAKIGMIGCVMLLAACSTLPASAESARSNTINGEVVRVWDGDTLHLQDGSGYRHKIRLAGIDAPELEQAQGKAVISTGSRWPTAVPGTTAATPENGRVRLNMPLMPKLRCKPKTSGSAYGGKLLRRHRGSFVTGSNNSTGIE